MTYQLRPATKQDYAWCKLIGQAGLRPYIEQIRGWNQALEDEGFKQHWRLSEISIITCEGKKVGYLKLERHPDHLYLDGLYIAKNFRSQGLGAQVLSHLMNSETLPLRLSVFKINPAKDLYARLGFQVLSETEHSVKMHYQQPLN
jgi:ribosomal protein S18 acetylase RimI-like enzyme